jgi:hypothetical protein
MIRQKSFLYAIYRVLGLWAVANEQMMDIIDIIDECGGAGGERS